MGSVNPSFSRGSWRLFAPQHSTSADRHRGEAQQFLMQWGEVMQRLLEAVRRRFGVGALAAAIAITAAAVPGVASAAYRQFYSATTPYDIDSIAIYQRNPTGGGLSNSYSISAPGAVFEDGFDKIKPITSTYFLGISTLTGPVAARAEDGEEPPVVEEHLVIAFNTVFALSAIGNEFTSLFASTDDYTYTEASLIDALHVLTIPNIDVDDPDRLEAASDLLFHFSDLVVDQGAGFGSTDTFSLVAFSDGQDAGSGFSFTTQVADAIPEPATWALSILGFGGAGAVLRRRRQQDTFTAA